jgi:uncharacterized protein YndB with AHSA1/START domain
MTVTNVVKDSEAHAMIITAEFEAPLERVWEIWSDPRQLERWWGPPAYPATVLEHDLRPGGVVTYLMTGPDGDKPHGWWKVAAVERPHRLSFSDGFGEHPNGTPEGMPVTETEVVLTALARGGTRMEITSRFPDAASMKQLLDMGMAEGMTAAMGQIDAIIAA